MYKNILKVLHEIRKTSAGNPDVGSKDFFGTPSSLVLVGGKNERWDEMNDIISNHVMRVSYKVVNFHPDKLCTSVSGCLMEAESMEGF